MSADNHTRVLVVDDNPHVRTIVREVLAAAGMEVRECADGAAALKLLQQWRPDITLVDYEMQPVNGVEFTREVRKGKIPRLRDMAVLMMTGHGDRARVMEAREAGVDGLMAKPLTIGAILSRIEAVLARVATRSKPLAKVA